MLFLFNNKIKMQ